GHTDNTGNQDKNKVLSQARAAAVVDFLRKAGVRADKLQAFGVGSAQPITSNETIEGRKQNRRIEFKVKSL
ncbi:MAG TPA: OmpA family protein, partial [Oceanospirillales bacterium]|nr:OmpA family protein [Oceanospirillales bacterium]